MKPTDIAKIEVTSRGKNRDLYGNVYVAFIVTIYIGGGHEPFMKLFESMTPGDNYESYCKSAALNLVRKTFGWSYDKSKRLESITKTVSHTTVYAESKLREPWCWRV